MGIAFEHLSQQLRSSSETVPVAAVDLEAIFYFVPHGSHGGMFGGESHQDGVEEDSLLFAIIGLACAIVHLFHFDVAVDQFVDGL